MVRKITAKALDKTEYEIDLAYKSETNVADKYKPNISIIPFLSFGLGTRLNFEKDTQRPDTEVQGWEGYIIRPGDAVVTNFYEKDDKIIIEAQQRTDKEEKQEFLNKIIKKINLDNNYNEKLFVDMLSNVFTDKQLECFLSIDDLEILLFDGLMYVKCENKAYRL